MAEAKDHPTGGRLPPREVHVTVLQQPPPAVVMGPVALKNSDYKDMFDLYRKQLEHEDTLVNYRVTFSTVVQAALVTFFVFIGNPTNGLDPNSVQAVRWGVPFAGILLVLYAGFGIGAAMRAWGRLADKASEVLTLWRAWAVENQCSLPLPDLPYGGGSKKVHFFGTVFGPWAFVLFALLWAAALWLMFNKPN